MPVQYVGLMAEHNSLAIPMKLKPLFLDALSCNAIYLSHAGKAKPINLD